MTPAQALRSIEQRVLAARLPLQETAKRLVFGKGDPESSVLFIGEAPGAKEDEQGVPFVGAAGKELDKLLRGIGLGIKDVYIANILKYRPPGNRDPNEEEIRAHTPFLLEQVKAIRPRIICTLGNYATKFVLGGMSVEGMRGVPGVTRLHGKAREVAFDGVVYKVMPLFHPAAALYNPRLRASLEEDFEAIGRLLRGGAVDEKRERQTGLAAFQEGRGG
ncbi:uracil-DNA glycosylase [Candidatus Woesearchaeota archaeon]|nr:uracil-DNA glycosylase [Candidatus Woesearchaeota archaeon]